MSSGFQFWYNSFLLTGFKSGLRKASFFKFLYLLSTLESAWSLFTFTVVRIRHDSFAHILCSSSENTSEVFLHFSLGALFQSVYSSGHKKKHHLEFGNFLKYVFFKALWCQRSLVNASQAKDPPQPWPL